MLIEGDEMALNLYTCEYFEQTPARNVILHVKLFIYYFFNVFEHSQPLVIVVGVYFSVACMSQ